MRVCLNVSLSVLTPGRNQENINCCCFLLVAILLFKSLLFYLLGGLKASSVLGVFIWKKERVPRRPPPPIHYPQPWEGSSTKLLLFLWTRGGTLQKAAGLIWGTFIAVYQRTSVRLWEPALRTKCQYLSARLEVSNSDMTETELEHFGTAVRLAGMWHFLQ